MKRKKRPIYIQITLTSEEARVFREEYERKIRENEERLDPLREQSDKAKIYLKNKEELENIEVALVVSDIDEYNYTYKEDKERIEELKEKISKVLSTSSTEQAKIEEIKNKISKLNSDLYLKQQELVKVSSNAEKLQGEKNLISERSKYESNDLKLHDNILALKEQLLSIENEIDLANKNLSIDETNNSDLSKELEELSTNIDKLENDKNNTLTSINSKIRELSMLKSRKDTLENEIENNSLLPSAVRSVLNNPKLFIGIDAVSNKIKEVLLHHNLATKQKKGKKWCFRKKTRGLKCLIYRSALKWGAMI